MRIPWRRAAILTALTGIYFAAGKLGLSLAVAHPSATPLWPATGITLVAFLVFGYGVAPAIFLGAFLVNVTTAGTVATSLGVALGNTLEGVVGCYLVSRFARGRDAFERAPDILRFALLAAGLSTLVSATLGVTSLALGGFARWADFGSIWLTWWLGDAGGNLLVAPLLLLWIQHPRVHWSARQALEGALLVVALIVVSGVVFSGLLPSETLCVPLLVWAAYRFGPRETATAVAIVAVIAAWQTLRDAGPFARGAVNASLLDLQAFMAVVSVTKLILAAVVAERRRVEDQLRRLSATDPLTGLANYRQLAGVLEGEIHRTGRTERPFAVLLFDLDGLKKINDRHGHLVGSRALCRLAEVLHTSCRAVDTAARFGGDEFAVVLPETDEAAGRRVVDRVMERLGRDTERPTLTVSVGVAMYPRDGDTLEKLLAAADGALYEVKRARRKSGPSGKVQT